MKKAIFTILLFMSFSARAEFICISRDHDGVAPFVFGYRTGVEVKHVFGTTFGNLNDCEFSLRSVRYYGNHALGCMSKDGDGVNPWIFGLFDDQGEAQSISDSVSATLQDCTTAVRRMVYSRNQRDTFLYCTSRDQDARAPFVAASINLATGQSEKGDDRFDDLNSCWNSL